MKQAIVFAVLISVVACAPPGSTPSKGPSVGANDIGFEGASNVAWGPRGIYVATDGNGGRIKILEVQPDGTGERDVPTGADDCDSTSALEPMSVGEALIYVRVCYPTGQQIDLVELNVDTGAERQLINSIGFPANGYGSNDGGSTWFASDSSGLCAWVSRVRGDGGPWPIQITDGPRAFDVDGGLVSEDCGSVGLASHVAVGTTGTLAFVAAPTSVGVTGASRIDINWNVYTVDGPAGVNRLATGFSRPTALAWNNATGTIELAARREGTQGLWSISTHGDITLLYEGALIDFAREPGGTRVAAVLHFGDAVDGTTRVVVLDP